MIPKLRVDLPQALSIDHSHCDLIGEGFGLKIRMVGKDPDVAELVSDPSSQVLIVEAV